MIINENLWTNIFPLLIKTRNLESRNDCSVDTQCNLIKKFIRSHTKEKLEATQELCFTKKYATGFDDQISRLFLLTFFLIRF